VKQVFRPTLTQAWMTAIPVSSAKAAPLPAMAVTRTRAAAAKSLLMIASSVLRSERGACFGKHCIRRRVRSAVGKERA
jgi:hypothetical protein